MRVEERRKRASEEHAFTVFRRQPAHLDWSGKLEDAGVPAHHQKQTENYS
jgi:hypothetical protein